MDPVWIEKIPASPLNDAAAAPSGVLLGQTFAVKDNIDVAGVPTTCACPDFAYTPERSARVVELLEAAGAIPIGKTNLDQFATGLNGTRSPYGIPACVFNKDYVSGGSSSGSAVAVAAGLAPGAMLAWALAMPRACIRATPRSQREPRSGRETRATRRERRVSGTALVAPNPSYVAVSPGAPLGAKLNGALANPCDRGARAIWR